MPDPNSTIRRIYIVDDIVSLIVLKIQFITFIKFLVDSSFISRSFVFLKAWIQSGSVEKHIGSSALIFPAECMLFEAVFAVLDETKGF